MAVMPQQLILAYIPTNMLMLVLSKQLINNQTSKKSRILSIKDTHRERDREANQNLLTDGHVEADQVRLGGSSAPTRTGNHASIDSSLDMR
jgi:hypothetical protein